jgi:hypothetical protein
MMEIGRMLSIMDLASTLLKMDTDMKESGKRTKCTVKALKPGLMVTVTRVASLMARDKGMVNIKKVVAPPTRESSTRTNARVKVLIMTPEYLSNRHLSAE